MKQLYIIEYESLHWCGGKSNVVVYASDEDDATELAEEHMDLEMRDLFLTEYEEQPELEDEPAYSVNSVEEFNPEHDQWKFFIDETQRISFYPIIGCAFEYIDPKTGKVNI